ncbi:MAG: MarR family winged helix-turn-helix transcriptional regulator [Candidatus Thiodiazotropha sp. (ex Monitilora ramsayi)]|nr:MarR family winged helix-turn-helix transcriptional regulator [Candidatus Thiodiazotropha sp. (ex Monitilora ramsayi)]
MENDICFNLAMRKSTRLITQFYERRFKAVDLKVGQFSILRATYLHRETTNKDLQGLLVLDQTTLSRNLKPLLRDGYLQIKPNVNDSRIKVISLTKAGKSLYKKALPIWAQAQEDVIQRLGVNNAKDVLNIADVFLDAFSDS